ncbi:hypothetical protein CEXT_151051 [Caerostris extrusa]|uniref:Uncharacterized protein n=1 Tax=Caerostris extrusa TaxID=172846 RepID=A0AAV4XRQ7_CAEEX|nr:hypothetical protein CEXT_151051 [Caerostris extrusa]
MDLAQRELQTLNRRVDRKKTSLNSTHRRIIIIEGKDHFQTKAFSQVSFELYSLPKKTTSRAKGYRAMESCGDTYANRMFQIYSSIHFFPISGTLFFCRLSSSC